MRCVVVDERVFHAAGVGAAERQVASTPVGIYDRTVVVDEASVFLKRRVAVALGWACVARRRVARFVVFCGAEQTSAGCSELPSVGDHVAGVVPSLARKRGLTAVLCAADVDRETSE